MAGLDNAGKSTILYKMANRDEEVQTTVGFNVEKVKVGKITFSIWDVGGQDAARPLWRHYFAGTKALIFVFDSTDRDRLKMSISELENLLKAEQLSRCPILIFLNKQDCADKMDRTELQQLLNGIEDLRSRTYLAQPAVATEGIGLVEGFKWLANQKRMK